VSRAIPPMNQTIKIIFLSLLSTATMLAVYHFFTNKQYVIVEENIPFTLTSENEIFFTDRFKNNFVSARPNDFIDAAQKSRDAVVFIRAIENKNLFDRKSTSSTGSGVIISPDGYLITNSHVIGDAQNIAVTLHDNREFNAEVVGNDPSTDLCLLKLEEQNLPFLLIGNSDSLHVGEWVIAIGNPYKLQSTVTAGIVSAKARNINVFDNASIESFIQTDAAVNPGNSGGALVNTLGELVGINTAIVTKSGSYEGFSFAIPANIVHKVINDIKEFGSVQRGWLGLDISNVNNEIAKEFGLSDVYGVHVEMVLKKGAAKEAGLRKNDIIIDVNGKATNSTPEFMAQIATYRPGDKLKLRVFRSGIEFTTYATLRNHLNTTDIITVRKDAILKEIGLEIRDLSTDELLDKKPGTKVVSVYSGSIVDKTNLEPGYIITSINEEPVRNANEAVDLLNDAKGTIVLEGYYEKYPGNFPYKFYFQ